MFVTLVHGHTYHRQLHLSATEVVQELFSSRRRVQVLENRFYLQI